MNRDTIDYLPEGAIELAAAAVLLGVGRQQANRLALTGKLATIAWYRPPGHNGGSIRLLDRAQVEQRAKAPRDKRGVVVDPNAAAWEAAQRSNPSPQAE